MGREWELSFRLGMRPWIAVAYSAPVEVKQKEPESDSGSGGEASNRASDIIAMIRKRQSN
jgi:hypothetical protein